MDMNVQEQPAACILRLKEAMTKFCFYSSASLQIKESDLFLLWIYVVRINKCNLLLSFVLV